MEPDVKLFLQTIVHTISLVLLWMLLAAWLGIRNGLLFFDEGVSLWHIVFYIGLIASGIALFIHLKGRWKMVKKFGRGNED